MTRGCSTARVRGCRGRRAPRTKCMAVFLSGGNTKRAAGIGDRATRRSIRAMSSAAFTALARSPVTAWDSISSAAARTCGSKPAWERLSELAATASTPRKALAPRDGSTTSPHSGAAAFSPRWARRVRSAAAQAFAERMGVWPLLRGLLSGRELGRRRDGAVGSAALPASCSAAFGWCPSPCRAMFTWMMAAARSRMPRPSADCSWARPGLADAMVRGESVVRSHAAPPQPIS